MRDVRRALLLLSMIGCAAARAEPASFDTLVAERDYLGARVRVRAELKSLKTPEAWYALRTRIVGYPQLGADLLLQGDRRFPPASGKGTAEASVAAADRLMMQKKFDAAFSAYQALTKWLKGRKDRGAPLARRNAEAAYPSYVHGMARALYGAKRYAEAAQVYEWISPDYPQFRQVLFERMWTAFRQGKADVALGMIASQKSDYFVRWLEPESYLVQVYLYKALCRDEELKEVMAEIEEFRGLLAKGKFTLADWAKMDLKTRALLNLVETPSTGDERGISAKSRLSEQKAIRQWLERLYQHDQARLREGLTTVQAYSQLAITPGMASSLKPVSSFPDRAAVLRAGLEIWPADKQEQWLDELGYHRFLGESRCAPAKR